MDVTSYDINIKADTCFPSVITHFYLAMEPFKILDINQSLAWSNYTSCPTHFTMFKWQHMGVWYTCISEDKFGLMNAILSSSGHFKGGEI
jgi:hypothetical protein